MTQAPLPLRSEPVAISVILTAHREGLIAGVTARSALEAVACATADGLACEIIVVLDRADALTTSLLQQALGARARYVQSDEGDPGGARNRGIEAARGACSTFLDADDLWSANWLTAAAALIEARPDCVAQSACNLVFGKRRLLWWHVDSESPLFDPAYLDWLHNWDAMSFARTEIYRRYPFRRNNLQLKFGHEDWHWSAWTHQEGIAHKPAPGTMHFKRARSGSQMEAVDRLGGIRWPLRAERVV